MGTSESSVSKLLGENVQKGRKNKNFTQTELAEKIGVSQKHLSDIETGTKFPSAVLIDKISKELDVTPALLFGGTDSFIDISNKVSELVMMNLQPKINHIFEDLRDIKKMMKNMRFTIQTDDDSNFQNL